MNQENYITDDEFILIDSVLTSDQLLSLRKPTPESEIIIKDNGLKSVTGSYMKKHLNVIFGFNYDFAIVSREYLAASKEVLVQGRLTIRTTKGTLIKEQFGTHKVELQTSSATGATVTAPFNIGNAYKAAATDAFKKCASEFGLCWDIYSQISPEEVPDNSYTPTHQELSVSKRIKTFLSQAKTIEEFTEIQSKLEQEVTLTEYLEHIISEELNNFNLRTDEK